LRIAAKATYNKHGANMTKDSKDMRDCGPGGTLARLLINSAAMPQDLHLMEWIAELQVNEFGKTPQPRHQNVIPHRLKLQQISTNQAKKDQRNVGNTNYTFRFPRT